MKHLQESYELFSISWNRENGQQINFEGSKQEIYKLLRVNDQETEQQTDSALPWVVPVRNFLIAQVVHNLFLLEKKFKTYLPVCVILAI